jgi:hypothetical protein
VLGGRWELCEDRNFGGRCITITDDVPNMESGFLGRISSIRPR